MELLFHGTPSVVVYKVRPLDLWVAGKLKTSPYISLVNLLAEKELFPEFLTDRCEAAAIAEHLLGWLNDDERYAAQAVRFLRRWWTARSASGGT